MARDFNHLPEWLPPRIEKTGLSLELFARQCKLSRAILYFYLNGTYRPTEESMTVMCRELGVPLEEGLAQYTPRKRPARTER
jgi:hypothetical protein